MNGKYEYTFIYLTHKDEFHKSKDINDIKLDLRKIERIGWNRALIENYKCKMNCNNYEKNFIF